MSTYENTARTDYGVSAVVAVVLTGLSYLVALAFGWIDKVNWLEALAVFTSYSCTYLCVRQRRFNYAIGAVSTAAFALLFWQSDLVASAILNLYLTPQLVYGWFRWRRDDDTRPVTDVSPREVPLYLLATGLFGAGAIAVVHLFDGTLAFWDSAILVLSVLAQWLLDNKKLQTWAVWAVVNVIAIVVYFKVGLPLTAFQYVLSLANTVYGYASWHQTREVTSAAAA